MKITVIIPTYNRADFLLVTINSIINQTYKVDEIIIVDDGSTDNTLEVLKKIENIKIIKTENHGVSHARNIGIKEAKNEWITFLDSDDEWLENKIEDQIKLHYMQKNILFSHTNEKWLKNGKDITYPKKLAKSNGSCFLQNISTCKIAASSVLLHKSIFDNIGYFDEDMSVCEDYDMWLRISYKYDIALMENEGIIKKAGHPQLSSSIFAIDRYHIYSLKKFLNTEFKDEIKKEIIKKCNILVKGAIKHKNQEIFEEYSKLIESVN